MMKNKKKLYSIELTEEEIDCLICGCWAEISDFCVNCEEEQPYRDLIARLEGVFSNDT